MPNILQNLKNSTNSNSASSRYENDSKNPLPNISQANSPKSNKKNFNFKFSAPVVLMFLVLAMQGLLTYLLLNPINLANSFVGVQRQNKAIAGVSNAPITAPKSISVVGDNVILKSADELRKGNAIEAEVYKEAKDGDVVLDYNTRVIIYRESENKVIYDGPSPYQKLTDANSTLINSIIKVIKEKGLIKDNPTQNPATAVVQNESEVKKTNVFYKDVMNNDIIAQFNDSGVIVVYRPSTGQLVSAGKIETIIK
jgi:hypothetical protein